MSELIEGKPFLAPGMCFICELSNPVRYVDTFRDFEGVVRERLDGRKYVCEECVTEFAKHLGFVTPKEAKGLVEEIRRLEGNLADATEQIAAFKDLKSALDVLRPKPSAAKKPAAAKA